jgi:hypothetical protein
MDLHAATVAAMHSAAVTAAAVSAAVALGAGDGRAEHCKAERSARGNGQKGGFPKHDILLMDPVRIV